MSAEEAKQYGIIDDIIVSTGRDADGSVAKDGRLELSSAGVGMRPEPKMDPEREGPKTSR